MLQTNVKIQPSELQTIKLYNPNNLHKLTLIHKEHKRQNKLLLACMSSATPAPEKPCVFAPNQLHGYDHKFYFTQCPINKAFKKLLI